MMIDMDKCFTGQQTITEDEFKSLSVVGKGYLVYMLGSRDDQPNVPENLTPTSKHDVADYQTGQRRAIMEVQDCP